MNYINEHNLVPIIFINSDLLPVQVVKRSTINLFSTSVIGPLKSLVAQQKKKAQKSEQIDA